MIDLSGSLGDAIERATTAVERIKIAGALQRFPSRTEAAESLGISARTLQSKMKELAIDDREDSDV